MEVSYFEENGQRWLGTDEEMKSPYDFEQLVAQQPDLYKFFHRFSSALPKADEYIKEYKESFGWNDWLIEQCSIFTASALLRPIRYDEPYWWCYGNARARALSTGVHYVEGLAVTPTGAFLHAWNSSDGQNVLDYTYPAQELNTYFGVVIKVGETIPYGWLGHLYDETIKGESGWATKQLELLERAA